MEIVECENQQDLALRAADLVAQEIASVTHLNLLVATGRTPMGLYAEMTRRAERGELRPENLRIFQLDDYVGVGPDDSRSLFGWMDRSLLRPLRITPEQVVRLRGDTDNPDVECRIYDAAVRAAGGYDLAILGLGLNGHLGFNEPPCAPDAPTRVVTLSPMSLASNAGYWGDKAAVPGRAITAGMDLILGSGRVLLLVCGEAKKEILERTITGPITPEVPASFLQQLARCTVVADRATLGALAEKTQ